MWNIHTYVYECTYMCICLFILFLLNILYKICFIAFIFFFFVNRKGVLVPTFSMFFFSFTINCICMWDILLQWFQITVKLICGYCVFSNMFFSIFFIYFIYNSFFHSPTIPTTLVYFFFLFFSYSLLSFIFWNNIYLIFYFCSI